MPEEPGEITLLLQQWQRGSCTAENNLFALVMPHLRRLAHHMMKGERQDHSMQATELVDEVYFRMVAAKDRDWQNRQHFFAIAARAMRRYLIDHARGRPHGENVALEGMQNLIPADSVNLDLAISIDRLLNELAEVRPEWCTLIEVKYFLGLNDEEAAEALGLKMRTMQRMWHEARKWLFQHVEGQNARQSAGR